MKPDIFNSTKHWKFTNNDEKAEQKFKLIEKQVRESLPDNFYKRPLIQLDLIKQTRLYSLMKNIPKGVMHHNHYFCNDDQGFYRKYIVTDSRIYLTSDLSGIQIGTAQQAKKNSWVSMKEGQEKEGQFNWLRRIVNLTAFTVNQMKEMNYKSKQTWNIFERKIRAPLKIMFVKDIFEKYSRHVLTKYIQNGYDRIQMRCTYDKLKEYDTEGRYVKEHPVQIFMESLDQIISQITKEYPNFTFGFIFVGFKMFTDQYNRESFDKICESNWDKLIGLDFVQEEDKYDSLQRYDPIINKVFEKYPHLDHLKKIYHAGQTTNHLTDNIDIAVKAGSVRIGHGINILQRTEFLLHCKHVCFQKNPISNLLLGYKSDLRDASAPILLGLGYPVSLSPDDPGKFGLDDTTADYFIAALSYNWSLRHLKLIGYHSINHSVCEQSVKTNLIRSFQSSWDKWVHKFLDSEHFTQVNNQYNPQDIFTFNKNWSFTQLQQEKNISFIKLVDKVIANIPQDIYQNNFISSYPLIKSSYLHGILTSMPKGTLQGCHFTSNHDIQFIKTYIIPCHYIYLNNYNNQLVITTAQQNEKHGRTSLQKLKLTFQNYQDLASYLYSLTSFTSHDLGQSAGHQNLFWSVFQKKYKNLLQLLTSRDIFRKYTKYVFKKMLMQNYSRAQFRIQPIKLIDYAQNGQIVKIHDYSEMIRIIDEQYANIIKQYSYFTVGFIILGNKNCKRQGNYDLFDYFANSNWKKIIGFDFEQTIEDNYQPLNEYDEIVNQILIKYDSAPYRKIYQAGNSNNHLNNNIEIALNSGSIRIANGLNILQQVGLLAKCKDICFQINPILNLAEGASKRTDFRLSIAPILLGLGFPITISSDFCGILGFQNNSTDLFMAAISNNWTLKHFKLIILHSINYSCATEGIKRLNLLHFESHWKKWIESVNFETI